MNVVPTAESPNPHLPSEGPNRLCCDVTLGRHAPPLIHVSTSIHAPSMGLVKHEIA